MWFGLLGPVRVRDGGRELGAGSRRERVVLAVLLLEGGRPVGGSRLIEAVWGPGAPPTAKAQLHNLVSALRRRVGGDVIRTRPTGYEVRVDGHVSDVDEFRSSARRARDAAGDGDHESVVSAVERALASWRGRALADVDGEWAEFARAGLEEERLGVAELRLRGLLGLGRADEVLTALPALVAAHPYRESLHEVRMSALAARGRRAEALDVYQEVHARFVAELGVEPGAGLVALQRRILSGEGWAPGVVSRLTPRQLPALSWRPVGRDALVAGVAEAVGAAGSVAVLAGPGGVGKTTIALAVAHSVADRFPDGQLYADLRGSRTPVDPYGVMARWLRALGVKGVPADTGLLTARYRERLAGCGVLVVLDDAGSAGQVLPLLPGAAGCGVLVTSRRQFADLPGGARWTVPQLSDEAALDLFRAVVGDDRVAADPAAAADVVAACGNLPLAVAIAAARLSTRPRWTLAGFAARLRAERGRLGELAVEDMDVRATIGLSYRALDAGARTLFRRLGLVSPDVPAWVVRRLGGSPEAVDQLVDVHLLEPTGVDAVGQRRFRLHELVSEFAAERAEREDTADERFSTTSDLVDAWLGLAGAADERLGHGMLAGRGVAVPAAPPEALPHVLGAPRAWLDVERRTLVGLVGEAADLGLADRAARLALRLVGYLGLLGNRDREQVMRTAVAAAREPGAGVPDDVRARLLTAMIASAAERDRPDELTDLLVEQRELAVRTGDRALEARSWSQAGLVARRQGRLAEAMRCNRAGLAACDDGTPAQVRSSALAGLAANHVEAGRPEEALPFAREAFELESAAGTARVAALHALTYGTALLDARRVDEAEEWFAGAMATATALDVPAMVAYARFRLASVAMRRDDPERADAWFREALGVFEATGDTTTTAEVHRAIADLAVLTDDLPRARDHLDRALAVWRHTGARLETARVHARLHLVLARTGDPAADAHREEVDATLRELGLAEQALRLPAFLTLG
ncbi:BTAD domain-containing putative transcriptional regulator [Actinosynnema sp. NPDC059335]|uniref:AfsR/SARP family transcriptional regulator n=1 Tax=Actinosynnema sp. NPDC059335 TaxID=3346804 RepID=UPI00366C233C